MARIGLVLFVLLILVTVKYGSSEETSDLQKEEKIRAKRHLQGHGHMSSSGINRMQNRQWAERGETHPEGPDVSHGMHHNYPRNDPNSPYQYYENGRFERRVAGMRHGMYPDRGHGHYNGHGYGPHHGRGNGCHGRHHWGGQRGHHWAGHGRHHWAGRRRHWGGHGMHHDRSHFGVFPNPNARQNEFNNGRRYGMNSNEGNARINGMNPVSSGSALSHGDGYIENRGLNTQGIYERQGNEEDSWMRDLDPQTGLPRLSAHEQRKVNFLSTAQNQFTVNLHQLLGLPVTDIVYSPYGIFQALTMIYIGSRTHTAFQMKRVLHLIGMGRHIHHSVRYQNILLSNPGSAIIEVANNIMMKPEIHVSQTFHDRLESSYEAHVSHFDFTHEGGPEAAINELVSEQTHDRIPRILNPGTIDENTDMVLINTLYFKARWKIPFMEERTSSVTFMKTTTEQTVVEMMNNEGWFKMATLPDHAARVLELQYEEDRFCMLLIVPDDTEGLAILEEDLTANVLAISLENAVPARVNVSLPKFRLDSTLSLKDNLKNMGMTKAFDARFSDFRGIASNNTLHITDIIHRTIIDVDEQGSDEIPTTPATVPESRNVSASTEFHCDHPFLFIIRDNVSKVNLFIGKFSGGL